MFNPCNDRQRQHGAGLIEVLIALLVMSFGLLAMARLSSAALLHQKSAQMRLTGVSLVQFYAERARLNVYGFDLGVYDLPLSAEVDDQALPMNSDAVDEDAATTVAAADRQAFLRLVSASLPGGDAQVVTRPSPQARELDVWLLWRDTPSGGDNALDAAAMQPCPKDLDDSVRDGRSCMHFRVGI